MPLAPIISSVRERLIDHGLTVHLVGDGESITVAMNLRHLRVLIAIGVPEKSRMVQVEAFLPVRIPEGRRPAALDFLSRGNWSMRSGRFVIDLDDGEVRLRQEIEHEDELLTLSRVDDRMLLCCITLDAFFPALMEVVFGNRCPKEALEQAEAAVASPGDEKSAKEQDDDLPEDTDDPESFVSCEDAEGGDEVEEAEVREVSEEPKASAEPVPAASPGPVTTARQVLAAWVPKCPARPVYEESGLLFYYEHGYRIYLSEPDSKAVRDRIRPGGSSSEGESPLT
jgi:hypothetical protein